MSYFGHAFRAFTWQREYPNETVMGAIEMALSPMLGGTRVKLCAAGRFFFFTVMGAIEMALSPMLGGTRVKLCAAGRFLFV